MKKRFWNYLNRVVDRVGNEYRLCMLGNLKGCIGDRVRMGITGAFEVSGENCNRRVVS